MKKSIAVVIAAVCAAMLLAGCSGGSSEKEASSAGTASESTAVSSVSEEKSTVSEASAVSEAVSVSETSETAANPYGLEDGVYTAKFDTDSSMFHVNEANEGRGVLTVENGQMTIHVSLAGKGIVNLYPGLAEDAKKDGAVLLEPTTDTVTYSDGLSDEVFGFDIPVPVLDEEFDVALVGTKGTWYDHKVSVSDVVPME